MLQGKHYRFMIPDMNAWDMVKSASRKAESWALSLADALPPYYIIEGTLESKRVDDKGRYSLIVNGAPISVDRPTYDTLAVGEHIRARHTRNSRVINIDRFLDSNGDN